MSLLSGKMLLPIIRARRQPEYLLKYYLSTKSKKAITNITFRKTNPDILKMVNFFTLGGK